MKALINYFNIFYKWVGTKIFLFAFLVLSTTIVESLGFTIALPILEYGSDPGESSRYTIFIYEFLESLNIKVSIVSLVALVTFIFVVKAIIRFIQVTIGLKVVFKFSQDLKFDLIERYRKMKYSYFINTEIGYFNNLITTEIATTIAAFNKYISVLVKIITVIVYLSFAFLFSWEITLTAVCSIVIIYFLFLPITNKIKRLNIILVKANASLQNSFIQFILNFKYLKATSNFLNPINNIKTAVKIQRNKGFESYLIESGTPIILELFSMILFLMGILFLVLIHDLEIASLLVTILFIYKSLLRIPEFQTAFQGFMAQSASVDVVEDARNQLEDNSEIFIGETINSFSSKITLHNIDFSFGDKQILSKINIKVPYQSSIGIVGESGSGKTTLVDIITGLLRPQSGKVEIDGMDYLSLNKETLRRLFGYITQEPIVFNDTIFNNITLWSGEDTDNECLKRVEKACNIANCSDFINGTDHGYNTIVGDRGIKLSGGQNQRLAIAREIYRDSPITIFDEATSSLDTKSENLIQGSIDNLIGEQTMIIIAHRLSTIRKCNYIYILDNGKVVQEGTWEALMHDSNLIFREMCKLQGITK